MDLQADRLASVVTNRMRIRSGEHTGTTAGLARGYVQGNLVVLPSEDAHHFRTFCLRNPKPCPILAIAEKGDPRLPSLGSDLDIRTDLPRYRIWRHGELEEEVSDVSRYWSKDLVTFVLGCSYSFEQALMDNGIRLKHIERGLDAPMFRTSIPTAPAGSFRGPLVVSMRSMRPADAIRAIQITTRFPMAHGAPVHIALPSAIGIRDLMAPDYGEGIPVDDDEVPVFWACGVTPQAAMATARPALAITHAPGCMLITDIPTSQIALM